MAKKKSIFRKIVKRIFIVLHIVIGLAILYPQFFKPAKYIWVNGFITLAIGIALLSLLKVNTPFWQLAIYSILIGAGVGAEAMQDLLRRRAAQRLMSGLLTGNVQAPPPSTIPQGLFLGGMNPPGQ